MPIEEVVHFLGFFPKCSFYLLLFLFLLPFNFLFLPSLFLCLYLDLQILGLLSIRLRVVELTQIIRLGPSFVFSRGDQISSLDLYFDLRLGWLLGFLDRLDLGGAVAQFFFTKRQQVNLCALQVVSKLVLAAADKADFKIVDQRRGI